MGLRSLSLKAGLKVDRDRFPGEYRQGYGHRATGHEDWGSGSDYKHCGPTSKTRNVTAGSRQQAGEQGGLWSRGNIELSVKLYL